MGGFLGKFLMIDGGYIEMGGFLGKIFNDIWGVLRAVRRPATYTEGGYAGGGIGMGVGDAGGSILGGWAFFCQIYKYFFLYAKL